MKRISAATTTHDRLLYKSLEDVAKMYRLRGEKIPRRMIIEYIRHARRRGWTYKLIGDALGLSADAVRRRHQAWKDEHHPL